MKIPKKAAKKKRAPSHAKKRCYRCGTKATHETKARQDICSSYPLCLGIYFRLGDMQKAAWQCSEDHGFHVPHQNVGERLMLIVSEVAEALECYRDGDMITHLDEKGKPLGFQTEIADVVIRCRDLAEAMGINLEQEILKKYAYNMTREYRHGGKKC